MGLFSPGDLGLRAKKFTPCTYKSLDNLALADVPS
jgi:hypothetical protein